MMPKVVNLTGQGRKPNEVGPNEVYIGRNTYNGWRKSKWHNPYLVDKPGKKRDGTREEVLAKYRKYLLSNAELMADLPELLGKDLFCWCAPEGCHGDLLLKLANELPR